VRDASIDLVHAKWVVEHLEDPARDFREVARVLKPGGKFVLLTPNAASIFTVLSTAIPYRLKQYLKHLMFGVHEEDTFRTWYRANTRAALDRVATEAGLVPDYFERLPGMWTFFIFAPPIARLVRRLEMVQACIPLLRPVLTYIIAVYKKS
jgi:SAM-dependent methyltransferase